MLRAIALAVLALVTVQQAHAQESPIEQAVAVHVPLLVFGSYETVLEPCDDCNAPNSTEVFKISDDPDEKLAAAVAQAVAAKYDASGSTSGYFLGKAKKAKVGDLDGIRLRVITPSEVFRDGKDDWDEYEIVAAVQGLSTTARATDSVTIWLLAENYFYRSRGGFTFGPDSGPQPNWAFSALSDFDAMNGRLQTIRDGVKSGMPTVPGEFGNSVETCLGFC